MFSSQHSHGDLQLPITPVPMDLIPFPELHGQRAHSGIRVVIDIYAGKTFISTLKNYFCCLLMILIRSETFLQ